MIPDKNKEQLIPIVHACYFTANSNGENFVPHHIFSYQISGSMIVNDGKQEYVFEPGDFRFSKRNQLAKYVKLPPPKGEFKTVAIFFDQQTLREFSTTYGYKAEKKDDTPGFIKLTASETYKSFVKSLLPYLEADQLRDKELLALKIKEALLILLRVNPELKDILFDFSEPGKIDLEGFMQKNFHFKVGINRFAYLTGRSLATFKRDFEKIFKTSPSRWLIQRRLQEAYYLIKEQGKRPSEIYFDLGFEDFSHFSYAFRRAYGAAPTKV
jgi:AraC family transcriptional regulator, exoenzyme S synthesis regulatory protein ExsA